MQIDKHKLYGACLDTGIAIIAKQIGIAHTTLGQKLKNPTEKMSISELSAVCEFLHPELAAQSAVNLYITGE